MTSSKGRPCSPAKLPTMLGDAKTLFFLENAIILEGAREHHFGHGIRVRNLIRLHAQGWTDHELDEMWHLVVMAGARRWRRQKGAMANDE